ncbi:MAG: tetratricopeptide repeat protein, partial [Candidatus Latescibacterota bacterium]
GECYVVLGTWAWYTPPNEIYPKASEYAKKAFEIDPNLAPAHAVLAGIAKEYENDWDKAEAHYRRAIELNPNYATARQWYAEFLGHQGRYAEAIEQVKTALELDPLSLVIIVVNGWIYAMAGDHDRALAEYQKAADLEPDFPPLHNNLSALYIRTGELDKAVQAQIRFMDLTASDETERAVVEQAKAVYERDGHQGSLRFGVQFLTQRYYEEYAPPVLIAGYFAQLGEADSAIVWLERGYEQRAAFMYAIAQFPMLFPLHSDPRFIDLLKRLDLEYALPDI